MKINLHIIFLIILSFAIAFSPSFVIGEISGGRKIEIRLEDILIVFLGLLWIAEFFYLKIKKVKKPPLLFPVLAWLSIGFLSVLTNWFFSTLSIDRGFFYFLKEVEFFFLYFYFFYHIKKINDVKFLLRIWLVLGAVNIGYVLYQVASGVSFGEYGAAAISEWGVFPTGSFFLILFIFFLNIFLYYYLNLNINIFKKIILGSFIFLLAVGVFASASKTNFLAFVFSIFLTTVLLLIKRRDFKLFAIIVLICILSGIFLVFVLNNIKTAPRLKDVFSLKSAFAAFIRTRINVMKIFWDDIINTPWYYYLIGRGKGFVHEAHNQFLRNFIEVGIIGSIIFFFLMLQIIFISARAFFKSNNHLSIGLSSGLLIATLVMLFFSFATEPFIVVKLSEAYWVFAAIEVAGLGL